MSEQKTPGIRFIVTSQCNYNCIGCHNEWEPKRGPIGGLEGGLIRELIFSARELGATEVDITGGEPLLEPERVGTILGVAKELGMWTNLTTNGYFLDEQTEMLSAQGLKELHVHVQSLDPKKYLEFMRGQADQRKVLDALESNRKRLGIVKANIPIFVGKNDSEIPAFIRYFNQLEITPRFIEGMPTLGFKGSPQRVFEDVIRAQVGDVQLRNSYLWGINEYSSTYGDFETLRCICFDRKCDICPQTNFLHVDQDYHIRPCNLRSFRLLAKQGGTTQTLKDALHYLEQQVDVPEEYQTIWGADRVPLNHRETKK